MGDPYICRYHKKKGASVNNAEAPFFVRIAFNLLRFMIGFTKSGNKLLCVTYSWCYNEQILILTLGISGD